MARTSTVNPTSNNPGTSLAEVSPREMRLADPAAVAAQAREAATIEVAAKMALYSPRNELAAQASVLAACGRPSFAEDVTYAFPRGNKMVKGPSVYLAREIARAWGHIHYGIRIVSMSRESVRIEGWAWDVQRGIRIPMEDEFRKLQQRRDKQTGETEWVEPDERDLRELINKRGAICVRNAILQLVPSDLVEDAIAEADKTLKLQSAGKLSKDRKTAVKDLVKGFAAVGVNVAMLETHLGHALDLCTDEEYASLVQIGKSIKSGEAKRDDFFDAAPAPTNNPTPQQSGPAAAETAPLSPSEPPPPVEPDPDADLFDMKKPHARDPRNYD